MKSGSIVSEATFQSWQNWIKHTKSRCHLHFELEGNSIESHIEISRISSRATVDRVVLDLPKEFKPKRVLEIGSSTGFNCLALAEKYSYASIHSVEPDKEAVVVADCMSKDFGLSYEPICGVGEKLEYPDKHFDLILCHTVIEHVADVPEVINEITRVLSVDGFVHLEAPNYLWPYEPHLGIWCIPKFGKNFARVASWVQGKSRDNWYLGHLQFVTPRYLESLFAQNNLQWENRVIGKLQRAAGDGVEIKRYKFLAKFLIVVDKIGIANILIKIVGKLGWYPSVMYTLHKLKTLN